MRSNSHHTRSFGRRAFTLIELLAVIAIIAILAAILFPVFGQAKESAKKAACLSNLKQVALAFNMYITDFDDMLPAAQYSVSSRDTIYFYYRVNTSTTPAIVDFTQGYICPYMKNVPILDCSSAHEVRPPWFYVGSERYPLAYGTNPQVISAVAPGYDYSALHDPLETILIGETVYYQTSAPRGLQRYHSLGSIGYGAYSLHGRHGNLQSVIAWADGHASVNKLSLRAFSYTSLPLQEVRDAKMGDLHKFPRLTQSTTDRTSRAPNGSTKETVDFYYYQRMKPPAP